MSIPKQIEEIIPHEHKKFIMDFFQNCPKEVYSQMEIKEYPKHYPLISTYDETRYVFFLLRGKLQAIEERIVLVPYQFTELNPVDIVGDYEVFTQTQGHYVTLTTLEASLTLRLPAITYENWLRKDAHALFIRTQMLMDILNKQAQQQRQFLFMNTTQKLFYYIYEKGSKEHSYPYKVEATREQMSAHIGCSVRQLNRILATLQKETMLQLQHGKILVHKQQLSLMKKQIEEFL